MEHLLWWLLFAATLIVYPVCLVRSALRGHQWAVDTLEAMRYVGGDLMTTSVWLSVPPEVERRALEPPERFVA